MENDVLNLIESLEQEALLYGESKAPEHVNESVRAQTTANYLRRYRDVLISIAQCTAGVASLAAQDALIATGHCAHASGKFESNNEAKTQQWLCLGCGKVSEQRLVPFE